MATLRNFYYEYLKTLRSPATAKWVLRDMETGDELILGKPGYPGRFADEEEGKAYLARHTRHIVDGISIEPQNSEDEALKNRAYMVVLHRAVRFEPDINPACESIIDTYGKRKENTNEK